MVDTFEMSIALINDNSSLMIIKTYQSILWENIYINLSKCHMILHVVYVTHFTISKSETPKRDLESRL